MPSIGTFEIFTILIVVLLLFGPAKLPEVGRQIGKAMREVRRVEASLRSEWSGLLDDTSPSAPTPTLPPKATPPPATDEAERTAAPDERADGALAGTTAEDRPAGASPAAPGEDRPSGAPPAG